MRAGVWRGGAAKAGTSAGPTGRGLAVRVALAGALVLFGAGTVLAASEADLTITKTDSADPVGVGATFSYNLQVTNLGPSAATSVVVTDTLPAGVGFVSVVAADWDCSHAAGTVTCTRQSMPPPGMMPITITVTAPVSIGTLTNTATVSANTTDPTPGNNSDTETTTVAVQADLSIAKTDSVDPVDAATNFSYTLAVSNAGPSPATSVVVTDTLPAGVTFVSADGTGWSCGQSGGTVTCTQASLAVGAASPIAITVTAPATGGTLNNTASVSSGTTDPTPANDSDAESTQVTPRADLSIAKTDSVDPVDAGTNFSYTLAVANAGPSAAVAVTVTDPLPAGVTFVSAAGAGWTCGEAGGTVTCTLPGLAVGTAPPITIAVTAPAEGGVVTNTATVSAATVDTTTGDNASSQATTVESLADLQITAAGPAIVDAGQNFPYSLQVANLGPSTAQSVTVTDALPADVTFVSASGSGWSCSHAAGTVTCSAPSLPAGPAGLITIVVTAPDEPAAFTNTVSVASTTADPVGANNSDDVITNASATADLSVTKTDSVDPVNAAANFDYTLAVANAGPSTAADVTVTDALPAGVTIVSATGTGWTCGEVAGTVTCTQATLAVGVASPITITVIAPATGGTLVNTATVSSGTADPTPANDSDGENTDVTDQADLSIAKTDSADPVNAGSNFDYTLAVSNTGPSTAADVTVTDTLPAGVAFVSASGTGWTCGEVAGTVTCTQATLAVGVASPITITVTAPATGGTLVNTATVSSGTADPTPANDSDSENTDVTAQAGLSIAKTDSVDPVNAGANFDYTLAVSNAGPSTAADVTVTDTLPAGVAFVSATGTGWTCGEAIGTVTCTQPSLAVGPASPITITVTAPAQGGALSNTATVSSGTQDPTPANDSDGENTDVTAQADLSIAKSDSVDPVNAAANFDYTLAVSNTGPSTAADVSVTDTLPAGVTFVSATGTGWTCGEASGTVTCTQPSLAAGPAAPITITVTAPAQGGTLSNTATVSSGTADPTPANDSDSENTDVTAQADLSIAKTDSVDPVNAGANFDYTLAVSNAGPSTAADVTVTDTLPAGVTFVSATGTGWTCGEASGTVTCTQPSLAVGPALPITITVTAPPEAGTLSNTASVSTSTDDPTPANDSDAEATDVAAQADLSVLKTDGQTAAVPGQQVIYTITVSNAGPSTVTGGSVADVVPAQLQGAGWTCAATPGSSCTASGTGDINDTVGLAAGGSLTYTLTATVSPGAVGAVVNTATVFATGVFDPDLADNESTDTDTLAPEADLSIANSDGHTVVVPGQSITYTIPVTNAGPSAVTGATVTGTAPAALLGATWTCIASAGSSCTAAGSGGINDTVNLLAGGTATYSLQGTVDTAGTLVSTATVSAPVSVTDPDPSNDTAVDTDTMGFPLAIEGELSHGTRLTASLESFGVNPDVDRFRILQEPYASYEVVVDAASGDLGAQGPVLERLASDGASVVQSSLPVGTGSARSLRWTNATTTAVDDQTIRVRSNGCASDCGADDVYRIRAWETTLSLPRFNNGASQITILLLQNPGTEPVAGHIYLWHAAGTVAAEVPFDLGAHQLLVFNTATVANGLSGSVTVVHDGPYGGLVGKTVALEPATGFSFDSPMRPRLR